MILDDPESLILAPASITELLNNPNSKIEDILIDNITFRFFNTGDPQLVRYFCNHVKDLLSFTFRLNDPSNPKRKNNSDNKKLSEEELWRYDQMSSRSFAILEHSDPTLTEAMLSNDQLRDIASSILWENNPESVLLSRLSSLTLVAFLYNPTIAQSSCGYVLQMLNYVSEPSILSLFEIVCSAEDRNVILQQWLMSLSFTDILYKEIEDIQLKISKSFDKTSCNKTSSENLLDEFQILMQKSQKANQYCGLLKIVTFCSKSLVLSQSVRTQRFVELLNKDLGLLPQFIEDIRWESIASMYCNQTSELLRGFFNPAINILQDSKLCTTLSGISAIHLMTTIVQNDQVLRPFMSIAGITKLIVKLMIEHPDHSFLHSAARNYLQISFQHPKTRTSALNDAIPAILEASKSLEDLIQNETQDELSTKTLNSEIPENLPLTSSENEASISPENSGNISPIGSPSKSFVNSELGSTIKRLSTSGEVIIAPVTEFDASLRASLFTVMNNAVNLGKTDQKTMNELKKIHGFLDFVRTELARYNQIAVKFYGGSAPPPQICNAKDMANDSVFRMRGF